MADKQAYRYSWVDQANQSNMLTEWSFGLVTNPTWARHNEQLRKKILILNQPTENEGMTMRPDKRVYPQNVKKSVPSEKKKEATPIQFETPLSDCSDEDDNDRRYKSVRNSEIKKKNTSNHGKPQEATPGPSREQSGSKDPRHGVDDYSQPETPTRKRQRTEDSGHGEWEYASRGPYRGRWNRPSRPRARAIHTPRGGYSHGEALDTAKHEERYDYGTDQYQPAPRGTRVGRGRNRSRGSRGRGEGQYAAERGTAPFQRGQRGQRRPRTPVRGRRPRTSRGWSSECPQQHAENNQWYQNKEYEQY